MGIMFSYLLTGSKICRRCILKGVERYSFQEGNYTAKCEFELQWNWFVKIDNQV